MIMDKFKEEELLENIIDAHFYMIDYYKLEKPKDYEKNISSEQGIIIQYLIRYAMLPNHPKYSTYIGKGISALLM